MVKEIKEGTLVRYNFTSRITIAKRGDLIVVIDTQHEKGPNVYLGKVISTGEEVYFHNDFVDILGELRHEKYERFTFESSKQTC